MRFADVIPNRWRTLGPHPTNGHGSPYAPDHDTVKVFYDGLPLVSLESMLTFVRQHRREGWRLRKVGGKWCVVR